MTGAEFLRVGIIMGSDSDRSTTDEASLSLREVGLEPTLDYESRVISAHRTPGLMVRYAQSAEGRGLQVIIAAAGGSAHLPGMVASETTLPVMGLAVTSHPEVMNPALGSLARMPEGKPLATFQAAHGARGAGKLALKILEQAEAGTNHVSIAAGSKHELATMNKTVKALESLGLVYGDDFDMNILDDLDDVNQLCGQVASAGIATIIAASSSSHMLANEISNRAKVPVLGVAITRNPDVMNDGLDALVNTKSEPIAAFQAAAGAFNAGLKAGRILGLTNPDIRDKINAYNEELKLTNIAKDNIMSRIGDVAYGELTDEALKDMIKVEKETVKAEPRV